MERTDWDVLSGPSWEVAPRLLGSYLVRELDERKLVGRIVELEAYDQSDAASHSYRGRTPRNDVMFGPPGHLYVYVSYGMHYCCNVVTGPEGHGSGVLIRAVEPVEGIHIMRELRHGVAEPQLANGPGKVCQALGIDKQFGGHDLHRAPLVLVLKEQLSPDKIVQTTRVGVSKAADKLWRFYIKDSPFISKK